MLSLEVSRSYGKRIFHCVFLKSRARVHKNFLSSIDFEGRDFEGEGRELGITDPSKLLRFVKVVYFVYQIHFAFKKM